MNNVNSLNYINHNLIEAHDLKKTETIYKNIRSRAGLLKSTFKLEQGDKDNHDAALKTVVQLSGVKIENIDDQNWP